MSALKKYLAQNVGDTDEEKSIDRYKYPEFYPENRSPFYNVIKFPLKKSASFMCETAYIEHFHFCQIPTGENSCYFDISKSTLFSLLARRGDFDHNAICEGFKENFFVHTEYNMDLRQEYMTRYWSRRN